MNIIFLFRLVSNTDEKTMKEGYIPRKSNGFIMNKFETKKLTQVISDPIDDYLECVTYCSISSSADENDCQTICMERHLKSSYF